MTARVAWIAYVLVAVVSVAPALVRGETVGDGVDAFGTHWFYWWIRQCVEHFGDPSWTNLFFYPFGKEIFQDTGNNFVDAVLSVPFQWVFGPVLYSPVFTFVLVLGNAAAFWPLARYLWGDKPEAALATLLWQTNPWILFEITAGRPTQGMTWFLPLTAWYLLRTLREPGWRAPVLLGLSMGVAGWTYWFSGFFLIFLGAPLVAVELWRAPDTRRAALRRLGVGAAVCLLLIAPAAVPMWLRTHQGVVAVLGPAAPGGPKQLANNVHSELHGLYLMETEGSPLFTMPAWGIPLLLALFWRSVVPPGGRLAWIAAFAVPLLFSFGLGVKIGDSVYIPNYPYVLLHSVVPFFGRLWFPYRIASVVFLPATVLVVALWSRLGARGWVAAVLVAGSLGQQAWQRVWPFVTHDPRPPPALDVITTRPGAVLFLPMGIQHDGIMWQTFFRRPLYGGMGESAPIFWPEGHHKRLRSQLIQMLRDATQGGQGPRKDLEKGKRALMGDGFRWIVLRHDLLAQRYGERATWQPVEDQISRLLEKPPVVSADGVAAWYLE